MLFFIEDPQLRVLFNCSGNADHFKGNSLRRIASKTVKNFRTERVKSTNPRKHILTQKLTAPSAAKTALLTLLLLAQFYHKNGVKRAVLQELTHF